MRFPLPALCRVSRDEARVKAALPLRPMKRPLGPWADDSPLPAQVDTVCCSQSASGHCHWSPRDLWSGSPSSVYV